MLQLFRYTLVSSASFALDLAILAALVEWGGVSAVAASIAGYLVALLVDYVASVLWVFSERRLVDKKLAEFAAFAAVGLAGLAVNTLVIAVCSGWLALHYAVAKTIAGFCVLLFTFFVRRRWLFHASATAVMRPARSAT